jgi:lysophospholipase L1-like esterase
MAGKNGRRGANEDKFLTPTVIGLYVLIIVVILLMVYFVYTQIVQGMEAPPERTTPPMPSVTSPMAYYTTTTTSALFSMYEPEETTSSLIVTKAQTTTPAPVTSPDPNETEIDIEEISEANNHYDENYFADDLFIGDSIMTGLSGYGYMPADQVFAKIGLNPSSALTEVVGDETLIQKVQAMQPAHVYIMLGSNGIAFLSGGDMAAYMKTLCTEIQTASPGTDICVSTIPPVTAAYEANQTDYSVTNAEINEYNALLKQMAADQGITLIDLHSRLTDADGYLADKYAEADGMHFLADAYVRMLSTFQSATEQP